MISHETAIRLSTAMERRGDLREAIEFLNGCVRARCDVSIEAGTRSVTINLPVDSVKIFLKDLESKVAIVITHLNQQAAKEIQEGENEHQKS